MSVAHHPFRVGRSASASRGCWQRPVITVTKGGAATLGASGCGGRALSSQVLTASRCQRRQGCGPVAHATITPSTALNRAGPEQRPGWSRAAPIPSGAGRWWPHPCAAAAALADAASAAAGPHPGHPGEPPEHGGLLRHAAGPGGRADRSGGERHRPAAALRPGGGDLPAGGDRGARSGGAGAAAGGPAAAALRSAQPRCGGRDGRGQRGARRSAEARPGARWSDAQPVRDRWNAADRQPGLGRQRPAREAPGALPGLAQHPHARICAAHPRRWRSGRGAGPGPQGSGVWPSPAAAGPGAAARFSCGQSAGRAAAGRGRDPAGAECAAGGSGRSGLHRQPGAGLAGGGGVAGGRCHGPGGDHSQPAGAGAPPPLRRRRLRRGGWCAPAGLGGVGGAGDAGARHQSPAQPGAAAAAASSVAVPAAGAAAAGGWGLEPEGAAGGGVLGGRCLGAQPLAVALEAPPGSTLPEGLRRPGSDGAGGNGLPRLRREARCRSAGGCPGPAGGDGQGASALPQRPGPE